MFRAVRRNFVSSAALRVQVGDRLPAVPLYHQTPKNAVDLAAQLADKKALVVGVPGAFSGACTANHVPGYLNNLDKFAAKGYKDIYVVAVNDAFVVDAWNKHFSDNFSTAGVTFLADPAAAFSSALDVTFDGSKFFGNERSKRYALAVDHGKVVKTFVEPDNTSVDVSDAAKVLAEL